MSKIQRFLKSVLPCTQKNPGSDKMLLCFGILGGAEVAWGSLCTPIGVKRQGGSRVQDGSLIQTRLGVLKRFSFEFRGELREWIGRPAGRATRSRLLRCLSGPSEVPNPGICHT